MCYLYKGCFKERIKEKFFRTDFVLSTGVHYDRILFTLVTALDFMQKPQTPGSDVVQLHEVGFTGVPWSEAEECKPNPVSQLWGHYIV